MLIESLLIMACGSPTPVYREMCNKASLAATKQSGVYQFVDNVDKQSQKIMMKEATNIGIEDLVVLSYMVDKINREKTISYSFNNPGILYINSLSLNASTKGTNGGLGLHWTLN